MSEAEAAPIAGHRVPSADRSGTYDTNLTWSDADMVRDALRRQAEANRATALAILAHAQRLGYNDKTTDSVPDIVPGCRCTSWRQGAGSRATDLVPDLLDSWYVAEGDAMDNSTKHERTVGVASTADRTARYTSKESTRCVVGTKRVVPHLRFSPLV